MKTPGALLGAWEAAALGVLEQLGCPPAPIDSILVALELGLRISPTKAPAAMLSGDHMLLWPKFSPRRVRWSAAHEIGHWSLMQRGLADPEDAADRVAEAVLLPWYAFDPDSCGWNVDELQRKHWFCSYETIARRVLSLRPSCISVWERGKLIRRRCSIGVREELEAVTPFETRLAACARKMGGIVQTGSRIVGFVDDERPQRVITLCGAVELAQHARLPS